MYAVRGARYKDLVSTESEKYTRYSTSLELNCLTSRQQAVGFTLLKCVCVENVLGYIGKSMYKLQRKGVYFVGAVCDTNNP